MKTPQEIEQFLNILEDSLGEGPLTLGIFCTKCGAQFELNKESVALAYITNARFMEYLKVVQSSSCSECSKEKE